MKRVLYLVNVQTPELVKIRQATGNQSLAGSRKAILLARGIGEEGCEVTIVSSGKTGRVSGKYWPGFGRRIDPFVSVVWTGFWEWGLPGHLDSFFRVFSQTIANIRRADYVIVYNITFETAACACVARLLRKVVILEYEDAVTEFRVAKNARYVSARRGLGVIERLFGRAAHIVLAPSDLLVARVRCQNKILAPTLIEKYGGKKATRCNYVFYGGGLDVSKGVGELLAALDAINCPVVISGAGPMESEVRQWCLKATERRFVGVVSREEYEDLVRGAQICVNPHSEAKHNGGLWPFKIVEYLGLCGAVVTTRMEGMPNELSARVILADSGNSRDLRKAIEAALTKNITDESRMANCDWAEQEFDKRKIATRLLAMAESITAKAGYPCHAVL